MADLTCGEIGKILQFNLVNIDQTQNPPLFGALDLTQASLVQLLFCITDSQGRSKTPTKTVTCNVTSTTGGVIQYTTVSGDLDPAPEMGKYGVFRYTIKVSFTGGAILYPIQDGQMTIKNDAAL